MHYDAIFFDLDGTVVDTLQDLTDAVNYTMRRFGLPEVPNTQVRQNLGWGSGGLMRRLFPQASEQRICALLEVYGPYYARHAAEKSAPYPGILPMLAQLRQMGLQLAILSNKPDDAVQILAERFFQGLISLAAGERPGIRRKPAPDLLVLAAERMGVELARCLYVGDSEVDLQTARNAGIDCVSVSWGFRDREQLLAAGAGHIVDRPEQLITFLQQKTAERRPAAQGASGEPCEISQDFPQNE